jgi:signal recognition particle receptor subunit beta
MSFINHGAREITCKLVYYGPGLCGKTTNVQYIHDHTQAQAHGKLVSLEAESERTLFFDFLPLTLGQIRGFTVRFHLYTVPGQVFFQASRRLILRGADGVVFVADSQPGRIDANIESLDCMYGSLRENGLENLPLVLQCNKQDIHGAMAIEELQHALGLGHVETFAAAAASGVGVFETLRAVGKAVMVRLGG